MWWDVELIRKLNGLALLCWSCLEVYCVQEPGKGLDDIVVIIEIVMSHVIREEHEFVRTLASFMQTL